MIQINLKKDDTLPLGGLLFLPEEEKNRRALLVYLHGAGERGENSEHLFRHALPALLQTGADIPAVVLCPQCPAAFVWNNLVTVIKACIDKTVDTYAIDPSRISITGSSMGGFGTWEMGLTYRSFFSAIAPVAGGGLSWRCGNLRSTPVRAYHGTEDADVPIVYSELMVDAVQRQGGSAKLIRLHGYAHNDGIDYAYGGTDLLSWLLNQRRTDFSYVPECLEEMF